MRSSTLVVIALITSALLGETVAHSQTRFNAKRSINLATAAQTVISADVNNDGLPDLLVGRYPDAPDRGNISVLLGKGNGTFQNEIKVIVGLDVGSGEYSPYIEDIEVAHLNNDQNLDLIVAHNQTPSPVNFNRFFATVRMGNGDGSFAPPSSYYFNQDSFSFLQAQSLTVGDFDLDGRTDVYVCGGRSPDIGFIYPMRNLGNGTFAVTAPRLLGANIHDTATGDFNQDGKPDLVSVTDRGSVILYGNGNLYFSSGEQRDDTRVQQKVTVGDFNLDGKQDYAVVDLWRQDVRTFVNSVTGFPLVPKSLFLKAEISKAIIQSDFNQDDIPDLAVPFFRLGKVRILYGRGDGSFRRGDELSSGLLSQGLAAADFDTDGKMDLVATNSEALPNEQVSVFLNSPNPKRYYADFDGDRKADRVVFRGSLGEWWILQSNNSTSRYHRFGIATDQIVPGNYDGDNRTDIAVFRNGTWYCLQSSDNALRVVNWGESGDLPVPADYNNDGLMEFAVFRPSSGMWHVRSPGGDRIENWGLDGDRPVPADYDGDGRVDIAVYRPTDGTWYILRSLNSQALVQPFGNMEDMPVPSDYDADGKADIAVFRASEGTWYILESLTTSVRRQQWGTSSDVPVPHDYDGDGRVDFAVYRSGTTTSPQSLWYIVHSSDESVSIVPWGIVNDVPLR